MLACRAAAQCKCTVCLAVSARLPSLARSHLHASLLLVAATMADYCLRCIRHGIVRQQLVASGYASGGNAHKPSLVCRGAIPAVLWPVSQKHLR